MIRELHLRAFKRFREERLDIRPLTLLTGFNSGGKSSAMQGLFLLQCAMSSGPRLPFFTRTVPLNAPGLFLGELRAVVNESVGGSTFSIGVRTQDVFVEWTFGEADLPTDSLAVPVSQILVDGSILSGDRSVVPAELLTRVETCSLVESLFRLRFVPADRLGPAVTYPLDDPERLLTPGPRAERALGHLYWLQLARLPLHNSALRHADVEVPPTISHQVQAWLADLFPGTEMELRPAPHANLLTLGIRTNKEHNFHRPQNVGFGVTYVLPVIIALLTARVGDIVLLENPESNLHPRAQARIGRLCARAAAAGVQVILETHSDHVLNGVRVAVHEGQIRPDDVSILFFGGPSSKPGTVVTHIHVDRAGRLDRWPGGFFDEGDKLLDRLLEPIGDTES